MNITIIGVGHVGLPTAAAFAQAGHNVLAVDSNKEKIRQLSNNIIPLYEPDLEVLVKNNIKAKKLGFSCSIKEGVEFGQVIFICVPTPTLQNGKTDLTYIEAVSREIAKYLKSYKVIVDRSTVPVNTGNEVKRLIKKYSNQGVDFDVASNPEFLREGQAVNDCLNPERVVIGTENTKAEKLLKEVYSPFKTNVITTDIKSAELIKHAANSFLAMKISYVNALSAICDRVGADIDKVALGIGMDKRIGPHFLQAGIGYGGSCFPKDIRAFNSIAKELGYDFQILKEVEKINLDSKERFINKVEKELWVLNGKVIACLGLAFKKDTDDIRESVAISIVRELLEKNAIIRAYDPKANENAKSELNNKNITFFKSALEACKGADCLLILTDWEEFKKLDYKKIKSVMQHPTVIDGRNHLDHIALKKLGFTYIGMGRI